MFHNRPDMEQCVKGLLYQTNKYTQFTSCCRKTCTPSAGFKTTSIFYINSMYVMNLYRADVRKSETMKIVIQNWA